MATSTIVICSSANFYEQAVELQDELEKKGYRVVIPRTARAMKEAGDYTVSKTWYNNPEDYTKKAELMRAHFKEIAEGDSILVLNNEKHGQPNYIGPNVLMEMGIAFYFNKPIFIFNELPEGSPFEEELKGFMPTVLHGKLDQLKP